MVTAEHDLGVVDDIKREDDRPDRGVPDLCPPDEICFRYKYDKKKLNVPRRRNKGEEYS